MEQILRTRKKLGPFNIIYSSLFDVSNAFDDSI